MDMKKNWCKLSYSAILDKRITFADAVIYAILNDISSDKEVGVQIASIAQLTGLSPTTITRSLKRLKDAGYIVSKRTDGRKLIIEIVREPEQISQRD